jgi:hypothetical protein
VLPETILGKRDHPSGAMPFWVRSMTSSEESFDRVLVWQPPQQLRVTGDDSGPPDSWFIMSVAPILGVACGYPFNR